MTQTTPTIDQAKLDRSLFHGLAWISIGKWGTQVLAWASTLVVARILNPVDYGIVSLATVYLGLLMIVSEFGVGSAIVYIRELDSEQVAQLNGLSVVLGFLGFAITAALAVPLGSFFSSPELPKVLVVMSAGFVISSFQSVPAALLQRDLRFRTLSIIDASRGAILALVSIGLAYLGFRYWTLVLGALLSAMLATIFTLIVRRHRIAIPRRSSIRDALRLSSHVLVSRVCWYGYSNSDFVVAGRTLGQVPLGSYTMAWNLASVPVEKIGTMIGSLAPAFFSAVQTDKAALRRYFCNLTEMIATVCFPLSIGMAIEARPFILLVLGEKWAASIAPLQLLCIYATVRCIAPLFAHVLNVTGDSRYGMSLATLNLIFFPPSFYVASRWGPAGIAAAWMIVYPILNFPLAKRTLGNLELPFGQYFQAIRPGLDGSIVMIASIFAFRAFVPMHASSTIRLIVEVALGAAAYVTPLFLFHRHRLQGILERFRASRKVQTAQ